MSITHVPVIGTFRYRDATETPASGQRVVFIARNPAVVDGQVITLPKKLTATLTAAGELPALFTLPTVAGGLYYIVRESFSGARDDYTIQVLPTDAQIDLATAPQVVPVEPMAAYLTSADIGVNVASQAAAISLDARVDALEAGGGGGTEVWREVVGAPDYTVNVRFPVGSWTPVTGPITFPEGASWLRIASNRFMPQTPHEVVARVRVKAAWKQTVIVGLPVPTQDATLYTNEEKTQAFAPDVVSFEKIFLPNKDEVGALLPMFSAKINVPGGGALVVDFTSIAVEIVPNKFYTDVVTHEIDAVAIGASASSDTPDPYSFTDFVFSSYADVNAALLAAATVTVTAVYPETNMDDALAPQSKFIALSAAVPLATPYALTKLPYYDYDADDGSTIDLWGIATKPAWATENAWNFVTLSIDGGDPIVAALWGNAP